MHIPKAIHKPCSVEMTVSKSGTRVEMVMADGKPYYQIAADVYRCPSCGTEIITAFARGPIAEHYQPGYRPLEAENQHHFAGDLS